MCIYVGGVYVYMKLANILADPGVEFGGTISPRLMRSCKPGENPDFWDQTTAFKFRWFWWFCSHLLLNRFFYINLHDSSPFHCNCYWFLNFSCPWSRLSRSRTFFHDNFTLIFLVIYSFPIFPHYFSWRVYIVIAVLPYSFCKWPMHARKLMLHTSLQLSATHFRLGQVFCVLSEQMGVTAVICRG